MQGLGERIVFVTGAARGIGRAIAARLVKEGAKVAIADLDADGARRTAAELGERAFPVAVDVADSASVKAAVGAALAHFGRIDGLVNNAGWDKVEPFVNTKEETWDKVLAINLRGPIAVTRAVLDGMIARKGGVIVRMGSDAGRMGEFREAVYGACKAGVIALSKSLAREVGRHGIRLNVVCPGMTIPATEADFGGLSMWAADANRAFSTPEMQARIAKAYPLRRVGKPEDVAPTVVFLASDAAAFITGQTVSVSGGYTMI